MGWQSEAMRQAGMSGAELGRQMQVVFPKASKATISMGMRPAETGLVFSRSANMLIAVLTGYVFPRKENRRCPVRIQARLTKAQARELNAARAVMGHATINDALVYALSMYIAESKRRAAANSATVRDGTGKCPIASIPSKEAVVNVQA